MSEPNKTQADVATSDCYPACIHIDPQGFVVFEFDDFNKRAFWIDRFVPPGPKGFWHMRTNSDKPPFRVSFKLDELPSVVTLRDGDGMISTRRKATG